MQPYKSIFQEDIQPLHEMSFIRGADIFLGGIKDFNNNSLSCLDKKNKDTFLRFCKSMKVFYKFISYEKMLEMEKTNKIDDWNELKKEEKNRIQELVKLLDKAPEFYFKPEETKTK